MAEFRRFLSIRISKMSVFLPFSCQNTEKTPEKTVGLYVEKLKIMKWLYFGEIQSFAF